MPEQTPVLPGDPKPESNHHDIKSFGEAKSLFLAMTAEVNGTKEALTKLSQEQVNNIAQLQQQLDRLEVSMKARGPVMGGGSSKDATHDPDAKAKAEVLDVFMRKGLRALAEPKHAALEPHVKTLTVGDDRQGGFLCPPEWSSEILKEIIEYNPMRTLASTQQFRGKEVWFPKRTAIPTAYFPGEAPATATTASNSAYGLIKIPAHIMRAVIEISVEALEDPAYDLQQQIVMDASEAFAQAEARNFLTGTGDNAPTGIITSLSGIAARISKSGNSTLLTGEGLIRAFYEPKSAYSSRGSWLMNRATIREVRLLKDSENRPIWGYNLAGLLTPALPTILDRPYFEAPEMAAPSSAGAFTTGDIAIIFADFARCYRIGDRRDVWINRDDKTLADKGIERFIVSKRVAGDVIMAEAGQLLQIGTL